MKQKTLTTILIFAVLFVMTNGKGVVGEAYAWDDCPRGLVNDEYPGSCSLYIDTDENGICDHSEPAPEDRIDGVQSEGTEEQITAPGTSPSPTPAILAVAVPLTVLVSYMGLKKLKTRRI